MTKEQPKEVLISWHDQSGSYVTTTYEKCVLDVVKNWDAVEFIIPRSKYEESKSYFDKVMKKCGYSLWRTDKDKKRGADYRFIYKGEQSF